MVFNSLHFLVFFMVITLWFFRVRGQGARLWLLLIGSCYFYMSFIPQYILILGGTIVVDYFAGLQIARSEGRSRRWWLIASVVANVGTLAIFKYYNFFVDNLQQGAHIFGGSLSLPLLQMALPIGLSFHTFQAMSYTIEVYRRKQQPERNFLVYSVYVLFYPQLVAGPIERPQNILHQLHEYRPLLAANVKEGITRMLWGFFKKVAIADRLAMTVDHTFLHTNSSSSLTLITGALAYTFQIYCDFSGYSDIAIGAAKVLNIDLMENFKQPFSATSISDFWRRWHISLYTWFNDYLFNPLSIYLRHWGAAAIVFSVLFTFALSGLWHGAAWHHIIYGLLHGLAITYEFVTRKARRRLFRQLPSGAAMLLGWGATFVFILLSRIFFRAPDVPTALTYLKGMFSFRGGTFTPGMHLPELAAAALLIIAMLVKEKLKPDHTIASNKQFYLYVAGMAIACYYLGVFLENQFIYFQF